MPTEAPASLVPALSHLLRDYGELVLDGSRVLSLLTPCLQVITRLFQQLFPWGPGSGFQALPSHPADSVPILQTQFVLDVFQKTPSLKLIHPPECPRQFEVTIFPFKTLRCLEIHCLPSHCLRGLRSVYSQLEVLTCYKSVTSLEEVISLCGGDLSSALPWLELHTLNFSFNTIRKLDNSLELLNRLKILDLSHNQIQDCGSYLKIPTELQYLNLGFNLLTKVPEISLEATAKLHSLILRHNQLSSTSGLEHLRSLQHLDLSFNLLYDHSQLSGLTPLHRLRKLFLEGNPLYFHKDHQALTARYLSPQTLKMMFLDGQLMATFELLKVSEEREKHLTPVSANKSSGTGDLTHSCSTADKGSTSLPPKKPKVKVRTASITEPSDSEADQRESQMKVVLKHQEDIERTDDFRKLYGADWLQYRDQLESELRQGDPQSSSLPPAGHTPSPAQDFFTCPILNSKTDWKLVSSKLNPSLDTKVPTAAGGAELEKEEDLEDDFWGKPESRGVAEEEEFVIVDPLCPPVTVCPILDGKSRYDDWPWVFLRITPQYLVEIELERGKVSFKRDLGNLEDIQTSAMPWEIKGEVKDCPVLTLIFDTTCEDLTRQQYVVLDNTPHLSIKTLLNVLHPIMEENLAVKAAAVKDPDHFRCLKCRNIFLSLELEADLHCPSCSSSSVILLPVLEKRGSLTPAAPPRGKAGTEEQNDDPGSTETSGSFVSGRDNTESDVFFSCEVDQQPPNNNGNRSKSRTPTPPLGQSALQTEDKVKALSGGSLGWSFFCSGLNQSSLQSEHRCSRQSFWFVDRRLRLYLDIEILVGNMEEYRFCIKVPIVRYGNPSEFCALVLVSNQKIYFMEITGEIGESPCDWLQPGEAHSLTSLTHLHIGLNQQTVHLGFDGPDAAYTLLTKNRSHSDIFFKDLIETFSELSPQFLNNLVQTHEETLTLQHHIWPVLNGKPGAQTTNTSEFLYLLVSFRREDAVKLRDADHCADFHSTDWNGVSPATDEASSPSSVSLLCTRKHMFILEETHQWFHKPPADGLSGPPDPVTVKEKQPIVNVSSVDLFRSEPGHLHIHTYNEVQRKESSWLIWTEDGKAPGEIVAWLKDPWEAEYHITFNQVTHDSVN
ncbi:serine/threonine-protein kinase 11-interacting protein-like [Pelodytes ibericus]